MHDTNRIDATAVWWHSFICLYKTDQLNKIELTNTLKGLETARTAARCQIQMQTIQI